MLAYVLQISTKIVVNSLQAFTVLPKSYLGLGR
jgi:hypothetical protein